MNIEAIEKCIVDAIVSVFMEAVTLGIFDRIAEDKDADVKRVINSEINRHLRITTRKGW